MLFSKTMRKTARLIKFAHIAEPLLKKELSERDIVLVVKLLIVCTKIAEESNMSAPKNRGFFIALLIIKKVDKIQEFLYSIMYSTLPFLGRF